MRIALMNLVIGPQVVGFTRGGIQTESTKSLHLITHQIHLMIHSNACHQEMLSRLDKNRLGSIQPLAINRIQARSIGIGRTNQDEIIFGLLWPFI